MIIRNRDGRIVGVIKKNVLTKKVDSRVHKLKIVDGYGIERYLLEQAKKKGAKKIKIIEADTGKQMEADISLFEDKSVELNLGYGLQLALAGTYWRVVSGQEKLL
jgi:hypothetical protein